MSKPHEPNSRKLVGNMAVFQAFHPKVYNNIQYVHRKEYNNLHYPDNEAQLAVAIESKQMSEKQTSK